MAQRGIREYHGKKMMSEQISDYLNGLKIDQHPSGKDEHQSPEDKAHNNHDYSLPSYGGISA